MPRSHLPLVTLFAASLVAASLAFGDEPPSKESPAETPSVAAPPPSHPAGTQDPVYVPPRRGVPGHRIGGGTRSGVGPLPTVLAVAPEHIGLTTRAQPTLYWYLSAPTDLRIDFVLISESNIDPIVETELDGPFAAGFQGVDLARIGVQLQSDEIYRWRIILRPDLMDRSADVLAGASIARVPPLQDGKAADGDDSLRRHASHGIWYDALDLVSRRITEKPDDARLRAQRAALVSQVELAPEVAELDRKPGP